MATKARPVDERNAVCDGGSAVRVGERPKRPLEVVEDGDQVAQQPLGRALP